MSIAMVRCVAPEAGRLAERLKAPVLKTGKGSHPSRVRISHLPPVISFGPFPDLGNEKARQFAGLFQRSWLPDQGSNLGPAD